MTYASLATDLILVWLCLATIPFAIFIGSAIDEWLERRNRKNHK